MDLLTNQQPNLHHDGGGCKLIKITIITMITIMMIIIIMVILKIVMMIIISVLLIIAKHLMFLKINKTYIYDIKNEI